MEYEDLAKKILKNIGGSENISEGWRCATRLRFKLKDESKADTEALENLNGVITVVQSAGQYQVVIGNSVAKAFDALTTLDPKLSSDVATEHDHQEHKNIISALLDFVSGVFTPFLGALAASGILKGLLVLLTTFEILSDESGAYEVWNAASDAIFYFLPLFIGFTAAKRLHVNQYVAVAIAGALLYPELITLLKKTGEIHFFGLPIQSATYSTSVIPILLAIWLLSYVEPLLDKAFPESVRNIFTPLLSIMIMVPLTLIVVGPLGNLASRGLAIALNALYNFSPLVAGFILGGLHQVIVIFGVHWALITLMINNISEFGKDPFLPIICIAVFAQAGAALGVFLKTKDKKMRSVSGAAFITAIFSITEPAIYGVNLKLKKPMYLALISSAIGGAVAGLGKVTASTFTFPGVLAIPTYLGHGFLFELTGLAIAFVLAIILTYIFGGVGDLTGQKNNAKKNTLTSDDFNVLPTKGKTIDLSSVKDQVFSSGAMGKGLAIIPDSNTIVSPIEGTVTTILKTKHAIGLTNNDGVEVLIHIGIDTVDLEGKYFSSFVKNGDKISQGQKLIRFDREKVRKAGYDPTVIMVITNSKNYPHLQVNIQNKKPIVFN